jgi:hypothetical protein
MNDDFLGGLKARPSAEFKARLHERLRRQENDPSVSDDDLVVTPRRLSWPWLAGGALAAAALALIVSPAVRASANAFLEMFRVRNFAVVSVDPDRLERFQDKSIDLKGLLSDNIESIREPGPPRKFTDVASAAAAAGFAVRVPDPVPSGLVADTLVVRDGGEARFTARTAKLREVLDALGLTDVRIPAGLDGAQVGLRQSASVIVPYRSEKRRITLIQAPSPEVTLPPGVAIDEVGEIGLRMAGLDEAEASRFTRSIDWESTMLVPLPTNAGSFRNVDIRGNKAILIATKAEPGPDGTGARAGSLLLWAEGEMVYALRGNVEGDDLVEMAINLR